jgi:hexosaminidase
LFPSTFIHIGGDEVDYEQWKCNPSVQARMKELHLEDEKELYGFFIKRMADFLKKQHRRMVGWEEVLEGKPEKDVVVMAWRSFDAGVEAARIGHDVVMAPSEWTYFDTYQSEDLNSEPLAIGGYLPLEKVYSFEPVPDSISMEEAAHILGAQGQLWTEYMPNEQHVEYMAFPRLTALSEVLWTPKEGRNYEVFKRRLQAHLLRLMNMEVNCHLAELFEG